MIRRWAMLLVLVTAWASGCSKPEKSEATPSPSAAPSAPRVVTGGAPTRTRMACGMLLQKMEEASQSIRMPIKTAPGSWGKIPPELQVLPQGAEHCGSVDAMGQAVVVSPMFGTDLETHYAPLFAKVGCAPFTCEIVRSDPYVQTRCKCKQGKTFGNVTTDTGNESFTISLVR